MGSTAVARAAGAQHATAATSRKANDAPTSVIGSGGLHAVEKHAPDPCERERQGGAADEAPEHDPDPFPDDERADVAVLRPDGRADCDLAAARRH